MLLAGGQGSRLGVLTQKVAKPAVSFGGKYRIIDFPLSNCINSGVDTVGVLTQYQPLRLNTHIGIGIPWDLDRNVGGVTVLPPYEKSKGVNISCPNVKQGGAAFGTSCESAEKVVKEVRRYAKKPMIVKLSPNLSLIHILRYDVVNRNFTIPKIKRAAI